MRTESDPGAVQARIDGLERRIATLTRALAAAATLLVLAIAATLAGGRASAAAQGRGAAAAEVVASRFTLVDATGRPRAVLSVDGPTAGLAISDPAGRTRVLLNTDGTSTKLAITGAREGFPRIVVAQNDDLQMLTLEDANTSHIGLVHSGATPSITVASGDHSAELGIAEVFAPRAKPSLTPRLALKQGERVVGELPAAPSR
jgi:hypothetical protein